MRNGSSLDNIVNMKIYKCEHCPELPALGRLASLETLVISGIQSVKHIGDDLCGFGVSSSSSAEITAFPKLKMLGIRDMAEWAVWELPVSKHRKVMPQLVHLDVRDCTKLRALPPLEKLESLENLVLDGLTSVKLFCDTTGPDIVAFPKLKKLKFHNLEEWEDWKFPISSDRKIMPCLHELKLYKCPMLRALPALGKLESLEILYIDRLTSVKQVGFEFFGISEEDVGAGVSSSSRGLFSSLWLVSRMGLEFVGLAGRRSHESRSVAQKQMVIFPKLTRLIISDMQGWEEWTIPFHQDRMIMPSLRDLSLYACPKLQMLPDVTKFTSLKSLRLSYLDSLVECREETISNKKYEDCPKLSIVPQYMSSPLLEELILKGD